MPRPTAILFRVLMLSVFCITLRGAAAFAESKTPSNAARQSAPAPRAYVPLEAFDLLLKNAANGVILRRDQFESLTEKAAGAVARGKPAPDGLVVTSSTYQARIAGDQLLMTAEIAFRRFAPGWRMLRLPFGSMRVESADLDGRPASVGRDAARSGTLVFFDERTPAGKLTLKLSTPIHRVGADRIAVVQLAGSAVADFRFRAKAGQTLFADGAAVKQTANGDEVEFGIGVGGRRELRLRISGGKQSRNGDPLLLATSNLGLFVRPADADWSATTAVEAIGRPVDRLEFTIPGTLKITDVAADGLEAWQWKPGEDADSRSTVVVSFQRPFRGQRSVTLKGIMGARDGEFWSVPNLLLEGADSHVGRLTIAHSNDVRLRVDEYDGVRLLASAGKTIPASTKVRPAEQPRTLAFRFYRATFELALYTSEYRSRVTAQTAAAINVADKGVQLSYSAAIETQAGPLNEVRLTLPAEWPVTSISVDGKPARWTAPPLEANIQHLRVSVPSPAARKPARRVTLLVHARRSLEFPDDDKGTADFNLPEIRLPQVAEARGAIGIFADEAFDIGIGKTTGLQNAPRQRPRQKFGFQYRATATQEKWYGGTLQVARKSPRVAVRTLSYTRLDPTALRSYFEFEFNISGGGLPKLNVSLPAEVSGDLRFRMIGGAGRITEQTAGAAAAGRRTWTLAFDRRVSGIGTIAVAVETERDRVQKTGNGLPVHRLLVSGAERQSGFVVVEAGDDQRLTIVARDATAGGDRQPAALPLTEIDPVELPVFSRGSRETRYVPRRRIVAAYRYVVPDYRVVISDERLAGPSVPSVICKKNEIGSVLAATGEFQHRALYQLKTGGVQGLRISLPEEAQPWATMLNGKPVEVRKESGGFFLPLSRYTHSEVNLEVFYQTQVELPQGVGPVGQQAPRLIVVRGTGQETPLEILESTWTLYTPHELRVVESGGLFQPAEAHEGSSLLVQFRRALSMESPRLLGQRLLLAVLLGSAVVVLILAYRRFAFAGIAAVAAIILAVCVVLVIPLTLSQSRKSDSNASFYTTASETGAVADMEKSSKAPSVVPGRKDDAPRDEGGKAGGKAEQKQDGKPRPARAPASEPTKPPDDQTVAGPGTAKKKSSGLPPESSRRSRTARLSVAVPFHPPAGHDATVFRYFGSALNEESDAADNQLELVAENQHAALMQRICTAAGVVLFFWLFRRRSVRTRSILAAAAVAFPPAIVTFAPVLWHVFLDGLFFGGLLGCLLWGIRWGVSSIDSHGKSGNATTWNHQSPATTAALMLGIGLLVCADGRAGERRSAPPRGPASANSAPQPEVRLAQAQAGKTSSPRREKSSPLPIPANAIVIPYEESADPLAADRVLVPYQEFARLWKRAHPEKRVSEASPVDGVVAQASHVAVVKPGAAAGRQLVAVKSRIVMYSFRDRRVLLPVPIGNVAYQSARLNGRPAVLVAKSLPKSRLRQQYASLPKPGMYVLDLEFHLPVERLGDGGRVRFPLRPVAAGRLSLQLPRPGLSVSIDGDEGVYRRRVAGGRETIELGVDSGGDLRIGWNPPRKRAAAADILHAKLSTRMQLDDAGLRQRTEIAVQIRRGKVNDLLFDVPAEFKLKRLAGADVAGWQMERKPNSTRIRVFFRQAVARSTSIVVDLFRAASFPIEEETTIGAPFIEVVGASRREETIRFAAGAQFDVRPEMRKGYTQTEAAEARKRDPFPAIDTGYRIALRTVSRDARLRFAVTRRPMQTAVRALHTVDVGDRAISLTSQLTFDLKGVARSKIILLMPEKFAIDRISGQAVAEWSTGEDASIVYLQLRSPQAGTVKLSIRGTRPHDADSDTASLGFPAPALATKLESQVAVTFQPGLDATLVETQGWNRVRAGRLPQELLRRDGRPVRFGLRTESTEPSVISLKISRVQAALSAEAVTLIRVTDVAVHQTLVARWKGFAGTSEPVAFTTPGWLADRIDFRVSRGVSVRRAPGPALANGRVRWIVRPDVISSGGIVVVGTAALPPPRAEQNQVRAPVLDFESQTAGENGVRFTSLPRQRHVAVVANHSSGKIEAEKPKSLVHVAPANLPKSIQFDRSMLSLIHQAVARVQIAPGAAEPAWFLRNLVVRKSAAAVVNRAELTLVVERDGTWRCLAEYSVKNQTRQFLALVLPEKSRVISVVVGDRASRTVHMRRNEVDYSLIPLPKSGEADLAINVRLVFAGRLAGGALPRGIQLQPTQIDLPAPRVVSRKDDPRFGIPVARTKWSVHLPADFDVDPETDADVTNVSPATAGEQSEFEELAILREYNELYRVLSSDDSGSRKKQAAWSNLQRLHTKIEKLQLSQPILGGRESSGGFGYSSSNPQLNAERLLFDRNASRVRSTFQAYRTKQDDALDQTQSLKLLTVQQQEAAVQKEAEGIVVRNTASPAPDSKILLPGMKQTPPLPDSIIRGMPGGRSDRQAPQMGGMPGVPGNLDEKAAGVLRSATRPPDFDVAVVGGWQRKPAASESREGVLSLDIAFDVPEESQVLSFTKPGGAPRLQLKVRPQQTRRTAMGMVFSGVWLILGIAIIIAATRLNSRALFGKVAPFAALILGAVGACLLPKLWSLIGFGLFVVGCAAITIRKTAHDPMPAETGARRQ